MAGKWGYLSRRIHSLLGPASGGSDRQSFFLSSCFLGLALLLSAPVAAQQSPQQLAEARDFGIEGQQAYDRGDFETAARLWERATQAFAAAADEAGRTQSLINHAQALQHLGLYPQACKSLILALAQDYEGCESDRMEALLDNLPEKPEGYQAIALRGLGDVLRHQGQLAPAKQVLQRSLQENSDPQQQTAGLLSLGNAERAIATLQRNRQNYEVTTDVLYSQDPALTLDLFTEASAAYESVARSPEPLVALQGRLNQLSLLLENRAWWQAEARERLASWERQGDREFVDLGRAFLAEFETTTDRQILDLQAEIEAGFAELPDSFAGLSARLNYAQSLLLFPSVERQTEASGSSPFSLEAFLEETLEQARDLDAAASIAYALGYMGQYYSERGQWAKATDLTERALAIAQEQTPTRDVRDLAFQWQAQLGRLLARQNDTEGAIAAYTNAYNLLQTLRADLNTSNPEVRFTFRQQVKPIYLELADLLLKSDLEPERLQAIAPLNWPVPEEADSGEPPGRLELARRVLESLQLAELDNFFQDPCIVQTEITAQIDNIDPNAAVLYPVVLPDRIEIVLSIPGRPLQAVTVPVGQTEVNETLDALYDLFGNESIDNSAINIFRTVPVNPQEVETNLQQLLPLLSQVYDWLIRPLEPALAENETETLVFVLNDRLQRVPLAALFDGQQYLLAKYGLALVPGLQLVDADPLEERSVEVLAAGVSEQVQLEEFIFPALSNVPRELEQIQATFPKSKTLLDREFTTIAVEESLQATAYPIVHFATHGQFSSNPENNFIVTGAGDRLDIAQLQTLLSSESLVAPELLVLSACQTATGDDRAVLGLAGTAVRSGARSTLATLWPVSDAATAKFMGDFYGQLGQGATKVEALRQSQLSLLQALQAETPTTVSVAASKFAVAAEPSPLTLPHPFYWSPYVLVGNWL